MSPEARSLLVLSAVGALNGEAEQLAERVTAEVSDFFEASVVRFAWSALSDVSRDAIAETIEKRSYKLATEGVLIETALLMPRNA